MIEVTIRLDDSGVLSGIRATGHSGAAARGHDVVCASASVLLRTLGRVVEARRGIDVKGSADSRGEFFLEIGSVEDTEYCWLRGVTAFVVAGLADLETEYPEYCSVSFKKS